MRLGRPWAVRPDDGETPAPPALYGLSDDGEGGWPWDEPDYGLVDDGEGGWEWSADPDYVLDGSNQWVAAS